MPTSISPFLYVLIGLLPSAIGLFCYIIRIEKALVKIQMQIIALQKAFNKCQQL